MLVLFLFMLVLTAAVGLWALRLHRQGAAILAELQALHLEVVRSKAPAFGRRGTGKVIVLRPGPPRK